MDRPQTGFWQWQQSEMVRRSDMLTREGRKNFGDSINADMFGGKETGMERHNAMKLNTTMATGVMFGNALLGE